jgi:ferrochelatase
MCSRLGRVRREAVVLVAHGTVEAETDIPDFLTKVRRGRPPPPALVAETRRRYALIGGSPLLRITNAQAAALSRRLDVPVVVAMRLWHPLLEEVLPRLVGAGVERACILPLAPFSVAVYHRAAVEAASAVGLADRLELVPVPPWGSEDSLIAGHADAIARAGPADATVVTAHSLPLSVLRHGDRYEVEVQECAQAVSARLGRQLTLAYQSQNSEGEWLGPDLAAVLREVRAKGARTVVLAPIGFLADHVETLYDLDIEAREWAQELGLELVRVAALNDSPALTEALASVAQRALDA